MKTIPLFLNKCIECRYLHILSLQPQGGATTILIIFPPLHSLFFSSNDILDYDHSLNKQWMLLNDEKGAFKVENKHFPKENLKHLYFKK